MLEDYNDSRIEPITLQILETKEDKGILFKAAFMLAKTSDKAAEYLMRRLEDNDPVIREVAAGALRETKDTSAIAPLKKLLNDPDPNVRMQAETSILFLDK